MLTIQEVGQEILQHSPRKVYFMVGSEFGVKNRYIQILKEHYGQYKEAESVLGIIDMMSTKHFIQPKPAVYVVRYDEEFISALDDKVAKKVMSSNVIGTIVGLYEVPKHDNKLTKYLPDATVSIDTISEQYIRKYLKQDFPKVPDRLIQLAAQYGSDYNDAQNICRAMSNSDYAELYKLSDKEIVQIFGKVDSTSDSLIRQGVASKNFRYLMDIIQNYDDNPDRILYATLSTMLEIDKIMSSKYAQSDIKDYVNRWTRKDVYNMFMNTYDMLKKLRSISSDVESSLVYLFSLLQFSEIPALEVLQ